jgi:hypothetical protein
MDLELLDPRDDDQLGFLIEALHEAGDLPWTGPEPAPPGRAGSSATARGDAPDPRRQRAPDLAGRCSG